jgi:hypothetical protein
MVLILFQLYIVAVIFIFIRSAHLKPQSLTKRCAPRPDRDSNRHSFQCCKYNYHMITATTTNISSIIIMS